MNTPYTKRIIIIPFALSLAYWTYLFFFSQMSIVFDACGYEAAGKLIHEAGWVTFFKTGPQREPFYSLLISISFALSELFNIHYQYMQKIIQIGLLLSTQILTLCILKKMRIHRAITALVILYIGISPALVGSAFSLFSEIVTYPFVLGVIIVSVYSWRLMLAGQGFRLFGAGLGLSFLFVILTLTKSIFQYIFWVCTIPFFVVFIQNILKKDIRLCAVHLMFLTILFSGFYSCVISYKYLNHRYNGNFVITNERSAGVLYGATARRSQEFNLKKLQTSLASIPGDGVCRSFFDEKECFYWSFMNVDKLMAEKWGELAGIFPPAEIEKQLTLSARNEFFKNPSANMLFAALESFKIFFWESTSAGFVLYPAFLTQIFQLTIFKNSLRLFVSLLTLISFFYGLFYFLRHWSMMSEASNQRMHVLFFCLLLIAGFTSLYALCYILIRYSFPVVPLFMICIAVFLDQAVLSIFQRKGARM